jgi:hypothetical protein
MNHHKNVKDPGPAPCPELAELGASWAELPIMERADRLRVLMDRGYSRRALARALGCSEALVRQLLEMEDLNEEEKQALQKGSLSVRRALHRVKGRENLERLPQLKEAEPESTVQIEPIVGAFKIWIEGLQLYGVQLKNLFDELRCGPAGLLHNGLPPEALICGQTILGMTPAQVIAASRPPGVIPVYAPYLINFAYVWHARWSRQLMPDPELRQTVLAL